MLFFTPTEWEVVLLSLKVAACCVGVGLPLATVVALILWRYNSPLATAFRGVIYLPLVLPPVVIGYLLLATLGPNQPLGALLLEQTGIRLAFDWKGAVLAAMIVSFPLMVQTIEQALAAIDPGYLQVARVLGTSRVRILFRIVLPMATPGFFSGAILAFARSLGEFGATITFAANISGRTRTLPLAIYTYINQPDQAASAWRLVALSVFISLAAMLTSHLLQKKLAKRYATAQQRY